MKQIFTVILLISCFGIGFMSYVDVSDLNKNSIEVDVRILESLLKKWKQQEMSGDISAKNQLKRENLQECADKKLDIVFVVDSSSSIGVSNFNSLKNFISGVVGQWDIGPDKTRVGVTLFGSSASDLFFLNDHTTQLDVQNAISNAPYSGGLTFMHEGLSNAQDTQFTTANGDRDQVADIVIAITDGRFSANSTTKTVANNLKSDDIRIISIGVGCTVDEEQVKDISSQPQEEGKDYFLSTGFDSLEQEVSTALAERICTIPDCGEPLVPEGGSVSYTHTLLGARATYTCDLGFGIVSGNEIRECQADGQWSGVMPECIDCLEKPMDIVFVVDASGSVGTNNFAIVTNFINNIIERLNIASDKTRVGYVRFASGSTSVIRLKDYNDKVSLQTAVSTVKYTGGTTNMKAGIKQLYDDQFTPANDERANATNIAIIMTDGKFNNPTDAVTNAETAISQGIHLFSIGIGNGVLEDQVKSISSPLQKKGKNYFLATDFQQLENELIEALPHQVCQAYEQEQE